MVKEQQIATWLFMMLTALRKQLLLSQSEFLAVVRDYQLVRFLINQYELLHYYDNDYVVIDLLKHIDEQGGDSRALRRAF